ncbi:hypothetical protein DPMN_104210 [Dreissena polymorpha]|uniref:Uncharacterized protein n=1 Tax=Dreissena polymorpha TaxID=45954 RepID=A0A9D4HBJ4_DREPO|nr:hypothetical protein DPMN_104210 [Dreissena polymorpha]
MFPKFRKDGQGRPSLTDTEAARRVKAEDRQWAKEYKPYEELKVSARRQCIEQGGNVQDAKQWMGFLQLEWGKFRYILSKHSIHK